MSGPVHEQETAAGRLRYPGKQGLAGAGEHRGHVWQQHRAERAAAGRSRLHRHLRPGVRRDSRGGRRAEAGDRRDTWSRDRSAETLSARYARSARRSPRRNARPSRPTSSDRSPGACPACCSTTNFGRRRGIRHGRSRPRGYASGGEFIMPRAYRSDHVPVSRAAHGTEAARRPDGQGAPALLDLLRTLPWPCGAPGSGRCHAVRRWAGHGSEL
jgi:hypothetical protein